MQNDKQTKMLADFIDASSSCFSIPVRYVSLHQLWADSPPLDATGLQLNEYLDGAGRSLFNFDFYKSSQDFRKEWHRTRGPAKPSVNLVTRCRWDDAKAISEEQRDEALRRLEVYKLWLCQKVLYDQHPIIVLPVHNAEECYRDAPPEERFPIQQAWDQLWLAPILGAPEITVPLGHVPYFSRISRQNEWLPVVASLLGKPRTDLSLINIAIKALQHAKIPTRVATGRQMWEPPWDFLELSPDS